MNFIKVAKKIGFIGISLLSAMAAINFFWDLTSKTEAINMIENDYKKVFDSRDYKVYYDYLYKKFSLDSATLRSTLEDLKSKKKVKYLFIKYGFFKNDRNSFSEFTFALSGLLSNGKSLDFKDEVGISKWDENSSKNYNLAFDILRKKDVIGVYGHRHRFDDGVIYPIDSAIKFLDSHHAKKYFFYPAFDKNSLFEHNFTSVIISNDSCLWQKVVSPEYFKLRADEDFLWR